MNTLQINTAKCKKKKTCNNCFKSKKCNVILHQAKIGKHEQYCYYFVLLLLIYFRFTKSRNTFFSLEKIAMSFFASDGVKLQKKCVHQPFIKMLACGAPLCRWYENYSKKVLVPKSKILHFTWHLCITLVTKIPSSLVAEFSVSICITPKFICSSDDRVPRLLIAEYDSSYIKVTFTKTVGCENHISLKSNL